MAVRVIDASGLPVAGHTVSFSPAPGHGSASPESAATDASGRAATSWTLGADPGVQTLAIAAGSVAAAVAAESVDLEAELRAAFAPPAAAEIDAVRRDWRARTPGVSGVQVELEEPFDLGGSPATLRIVSHRVGGMRHMGAIIVPSGAGERRLPVLAYLHGGENGANLGDLRVIAQATGEIRDRFVYVVPAFRGEAIHHDGVTWQSEGGRDLWDRDVDDALSLLSVALEAAPEADPESINLVGFSRGAGVALLAGIRDTRVARIVAFFGPTLFFDDWVRGIVRNAALRLPQSVTGLATLDSTLIQPYIRGDLSLAEVRLHLVRRSAALFAADMPPVQLHHGTFDLTVPVGQAEALIAAMQELGRGAPDFEHHIYEGGGHHPFLLEGSIERAAAYLARALDADGRSTGHRRTKDAASHP